MKLNLQHMHLLTTVIILSTTPGAYSQISFADMVDKAKAKFYDSTTVDADSTFGFGTRLFLEVSEISPENVLISPLSVYNALNLLQEGSTPGSKTESQFKILGYQPVIGDTDNGDVILETATSIWADDLKQSYIKKMKSKHSSEAEAFPLPSTYTPVNEWIEEETNGLIRDFIQPVSPGPLGPTLVSTVYFNGTWSDQFQFDPDDTVDGYFTLRDGTE